MWGYPIIHVSWFINFNKNIPLSFKFEQNYVSENNIDVNVIVQTIKNDKCPDEYPIKLLKKEENED